MSPQLRILPSPFPSLTRSFCPLLSTSPPPRSPAPMFWCWSSLFSSFCIFLLAIVIRG
jgi:hypothetical protein